MHQNLDESLTLSRPQNFFVGLHDITMILPHFSSIISVHRKKREGHMTFYSIFIARKVSLVRFFVGSEQIWMNFMLIELSKAPKRNKIWMNV